MTATLLELAARVEAADGPDRGLDAEIDRLLGWKRVENPTSAGGLIDMWHAPDGTICRRDEAKHMYTASIDAALTLVPDGCGPVELVIAGSGQAFIHASDPCAGYVGSCKYAATPALALLAACLKAHGGGE